MYGKHHEKQGNCGHHKRRGRGRRHSGHRKEPMFAMKRPLRFLVHKLDLDDDQALVVADAFNDFRIEKAQFEVDRSRAKKRLLDALKKADFDEEMAASSVDASSAAVLALETAFTDALRKIHAVLSDEQRQKLAVVLGTIGFEH